MGVFSYQPEFNYDAVNASNSPETNKHLLPFKGGFLKGLEVHLVNADNVQKFIATAPPETRREISKNTREIDAALVAIMRLYGDIENALGARSLDSLAHREYYTHFLEGEIEEPKMDYVRLIKSYELIKRFNLDVVEHWWKLAHIFETFTATSTERQFLEQVLVYRIYPRIDLCNLTNLLLRRLAYVLKIDSEEMTGGRITVRGHYSNLIVYTYSTIFREDISEIIDSLQAAERPSDSRLKAPEPIKEIRDTAIKSPYLLDTRGSEPFNQTYAYVLEINQSRFALEEAKVGRSIYVETHLGAEDEALRQDLIRKFISAARNKDRVGEYRAFLNSYFQFTRDTLLMQEQRIPPSDHALFLYHFGPLFFARICTHFMRVGRTGYVHRHLKRNQMVRELPYEYVKYVLKEWWDENVYTQVPRQERNSYAAYERLLDMIRAEWQEHQLRLLAQIRRDPALLRSFNLHEVRTLGIFVENQISFTYHVRILRFLGQDFFYLPLHTKTQQA